MKSWISISLIILLGLASALLIGFGPDYFSIGESDMDGEQEGLSEQIIIKFSHVVAEYTPKGLAVDRFAKLVKEKTNGKVEVQVFPNSILHSEQTEIPALISGEIQMIAPAYSHLSGTIPQWSVLELPYVFLNYQEVETAFQGKIGEILFSTLEKSGMKGLAFWSSGFKQVTANQPLIMPADFHGQRIRIIPSKVLDTHYRTLGAIPVGSSFGDLYSLLATGKVDGEENTVSNLYTKRLYEVQKHLTVSNHNFLGYAVIVNEPFWKELPDDLKQAIEEALKEATAFNNQLSVEMNAQQLEEVLTKELMQTHIQTEEERAAWRQALQPVYDSFAPQIGPELMQEIEKLHLAR